MTIATKYSSIELLQAALTDRDFVIQNLTLNDRAYTRFTAPSGRSWLTQDAHIGYPFTTAAVMKVSRDKYLAHELAETLDVQSPHTVQVTTKQTDEDLRELLKHAPLVVKPSNASLSNGVTLQVRTLPVLEAALSVAQAFSSVALVQSQAEGDEIRFVLFDGVVKAAILRQTPRLVGDGVSSVQALLNDENAERRALELPYLQYPELDQTLIDFGAVRMEEIMPAGTILELSRATMIRNGASIYNVFEDVHISYIQVAEKLATSITARFIVVDIIIQDYAAPLTESNYAFLEFNTAPVLKLFYSCRDGKQFDVITNLVSMIDTTLTKGQA